MTLPRRPRLVAALAAGALLFAACGDDDSGSNDSVATTAATTPNTTTATTTPNTTAAPSALEAADAWSLATPGGTDLGAVFVTLTSDTDDALVAATVDPSIARGRVEIHETTTNHSGQMSMSPVTRLPLPAGQAVELSPGGHHIMLIELAAPLTVGETFDITLALESGAEVTVAVEVREDAS